MRSGWASKPGDELKWRRTKMLSAALGTVGFLLLVLSFEQMVRSNIVADAERANEMQLIDGKFSIAHEMALACSRDDEDSRRTCSDLRMVDNTFDFRLLSMEGNVPKLAVPFENHRLDILVTQLNTYIDEINVTRAGLTAPQMLSVDTRIRIAFISCILVALSVAGSLGESIFQFRQARRQAAEST